MEAVWLAAERKQSDAEHSPAPVPASKVDRTAMQITILKRFRISRMPGFLKPAKNFVRIQLFRESVWYCYYVP